jgi:hypothetical protein
MQRRRFLGRSVLGGAAAGSLQAQPPARLKKSATLPQGLATAALANSRSGWSPFTVPDYYTYADDLVIEPNQTGKPTTSRSTPADSSPNWWTKATLLT